MSGDEIEAGNDGYQRLVSRISRLVVAVRKTRAAIDRDYGVLERKSVGFLDRAVGVNTGRQKRSVSEGSSRHKGTYLFPNVCQWPIVGPL
jgi:hypothetical protein